jgi:hypothetical protein
MIADVTVAACPSVYLTRASPWKFDKGVPFTNFIGYNPWQTIACEKNLIIIY